MNIKESLSVGPVEILFTKADGTSRKMRATTNPGLFPATVTSGKIDHTGGVLTVWDLDKSDWRSVREDRITKWTVA